MQPALILLEWVLFTPLYDWFSPAFDVHPVPKHQKRHSDDTKCEHLPQRRDGIG